MPENTDKLNHLLEKLEDLSKRQEDFSKEIRNLRIEISKLKDPEVRFPFEEIKVNPSIPALEPEKKEQAVSLNSPDKAEETQENPKSSIPKLPFSNTSKSSFEKFIGENLINKIGIIITVLGVGIGAKYSIEHDLISPLTRIILGYLMGIGLMVVGIKLKKNYENYSAVLVSGAIAIMYFITFAAFSFYGLIPQGMTFALMVAFTCFTVVAAINYNNQVIALIGLVGAYAVPFLLSDGSGRVLILFSYMSLINIGILVIAFKKYWKPLYYASFILSWLIFFMWYTSDYETNLHFGIALVFLSVFFSTFYAIFLSYKLIQKENFEKTDILLLLSNSFIFYGIGYSILSYNETGNQLLGLFTLGNAIIHFGVSIIFYKQKLADRNLFFLVASLVLVFISIAIPVQLDGNWVTLLWALEATLLFWIGRTKNVPVYEKLSYVLMYLAFFSILHDWTSVYSQYSKGYEESGLSPILNINFLTSILFLAAFAFILILNNNDKFSPVLFRRKSLQSFVRLSIPIIFLVVLYNAFQMEITCYFDQLYADSALEIKAENEDYLNFYWNRDLLSLKNIWVINYSLLFFSVLSFVNIRKFKNKQATQINIILNIYVLFMFLTQGLITLSSLRDSYLNHSLAEYYMRDEFNITIRYISLAFAGLMIFTIYRYIKQDFIKPVSSRLRSIVDFVLYGSILWIASSELIAWMDLTEVGQSYKLGLTILWGIYALLLIALGIWKKKRHLRIGAIGLFALTLIKLFFYDISELNTIAKTVVFVSLGILLLIISFLYNKYKHIIADENEN